MLLSPPQVPHPPEAPREPRPGLGTETQIWLVRHQRVDASTLAYGDEDVPLSAEGQRGTDAVERAVRSALRPARVVASPLIRARRMGEAIARGTGAELVLDDRLKEMNRGDWQGLPRTEYAARWRSESERYWSDPLRWSPPGGESEEALVARTFPVLEELARHPAESPVRVLAAHRQVIRSLVAAAIGIPPGQSHAMQLAPGHSVLIADTGDRWSLLRSNVSIPGAPHLTEPSSGPVQDVPTRRA
ncbi:MAG: histidine phosphatase family protein [Planctomycetota bacterium]